MSVRATVSAEVVKLLGLIKPSTYTTNIGANVQEWPVDPITTALPCVGVRDGPDTITVEGPHRAFHRHSILFEIEAYQSGSNPATVLTYLRNAITDVYAAFASSTVFIEPAYEIEPRGDEITLNRDGTNIGSALISIAISCTTPKWSDTIKNT